MNSFRWHFKIVIYHRGEMKRIIKLYTSIINIQKQMVETKFMIFIRDQPEQRDTQTT